MRCAAPMFAFLLACIPEAAGETQVGAYASYVEGSSPIILVAGHGGGMSEESWPVRNNERTVTARDGYTGPITSAIRQHLEEDHSLRPYVVMCRIHRKHADMNRAPGPRAYESDVGKAAHEEFHARIEQAIEHALSTWRFVFLFDIHGQSKYPGDIYLGNLRRKTMNDIALHSREEGFTGRDSLQELLRRRGYTVPADNPPPGPYEVPGGVSGGYIVDHYGKRLRVDAVQVEIHKRIRYDKAAREKLTIDLAESIAQFYRSHVFPPNR